jgi:prevent-host-death family protein
MSSIDLKNIKPLTEFRNHMKEYIDELRVNKKPIILTQHGKSAAVMLDPDKFQELQDEIKFMRKVALGLEDAKKKRFHSLDEVVDDVENIISKSAKR